MEVPPMTRTEAVKEFFKKAVLPVAIAGLLYCIFKSACIRNGELDLLWLWIRVCPQFCVNTAGQCKIEQKYFKAGAASAAAALSTK